MPLPKNEKKRLEVLWEYEVLDTVPEQVFDDLAYLAASICGTPVALITLVDEKRQWFKSKVGVGISETPREISICSHAILQKNIFVVPDTTQDPRFAQNPLVTGDPKIRFYAGAPLITPGGQSLGTLCVVDMVPRSLRPDQQRALQILSRHVMGQLELRRRSLELARSSQERERINRRLQKVRAELVKAHRQMADIKVRLQKERRKGVGRMVVKSRR